MSGKIKSLRGQRVSPAVKLSELLDRADGFEYVAVVWVDKDGKIDCDWNDAEVRDLSLMSTYFFFQVLLWIGENSERR